MEENKNDVKVKSMYEDDIFNVPFDKVTLPSEAKLYSGEIPAQIDVEYLMTKDEDILYSSELMTNGATFNTLVREKLKNKSIKVEDLLLGDFNEILLFLRKSAYGNIYTTNTLDPDTNEPIKHPVNLDLLTRKPLITEFDEMGEFEYVMKVINKRVTFKMMTVGMGDFINARAEKQKDKRTGVIPFIKTRLESIIMSVDGNREKAYISRFVDVIPPIDRLNFMKYIDSIEPGVDLTYTFTSSIKQNEYTDKIILGYDFFYPVTV